MCEPDMIFRRETQARFGQLPGESAHQHALYAGPFAGIWQAVPRESEKHRQYDEALLSIQQGGDATLQRANGYDAEIEAFFGDILLVN